MIKIRLFLLLFIVQCNIYAQTGNITGILLTDSSLAAPYIKVRIENTPFYTLSNGGGMFYFNSIPVGEYLLTIQSSNYITRKQEVIVKSNQTTNIKVFLTEKTAILPEVVVGINSQTALLTRKIHIKKTKLGVKSLSLWY